MKETAVILVVDDNPSMAKTLADILGIKGFEVHAAYSGLEALAILQSQPVDILLTDVVMPDMNGPELYRKLLASHQDIKSLYMSGYTNNAIVHHGVIDEGINFIQKPFTVKELSKKIDAILSMPENL